MTVVNDQNDVECDNVDEYCDDVTEGGSVPTSDCSWKLADKSRAGFVQKF